MLNAYMVFSRNAGPRECAELVFAHSAQEARVIGWQTCSGDFTDDYLDFAAKRIRNAPWLFDEINFTKKERDEAHVIWNPKSCSVCECWGHAPIAYDGICADCHDDRQSA